MEIRSSVYCNVITGVPSYGRNFTKIECANHAIKCYRNRLEALCNDKVNYCSKHGLTQALMKWGMVFYQDAQCHCNVATLRHDLRNGL